MTRHRLSPHFTVEEFDCHDGTKVPRESIPALEELCRNILEPLRDKYGPCKVLSGYRHRTYNKSIGGARYSQHIYDDTPGSVACDITFGKGTPNDWARSARWRFVTKRIWNGRSRLLWRRRAGKRGGVGTYNASVFVHVDSGPRRDWWG